MKNIVLVLVVASLMFSCQNENTEEQNYWIEEINQQIETYDKSAEVVFEKTKKHSKFIGGSLTQLYKEDDNGLYKLVANGDVLDLKSQTEIYFKDNQLIYFKFKGYNILQKNSSVKNDKLELIEKKIFFKSSEKAVIFFRENTTMSLNRLENNYNDLNGIPFEKSQLDNAKEEYERIVNEVQELKKNLEGLVQ